MPLINDKLKCRDYNAYKRNCDVCDIRVKSECRKKFNFDTPQRFVEVKSRDHAQFTWSECPSCGRTLGHRPDLINFRCPRCNQLISWKA